MEQSYTQATLVLAAGDPREIAARLERVPVVLSRRVDNPEPGWVVPIKYRLYDRVIAISDAIRAVLVGCGVPAARMKRFSWV